MLLTIVLTAFGLALVSGAIALVLNLRSIVDLHDAFGDHINDDERHK